MEMRHLNLLTGEWMISETVPVNEGMSPMNLSPEQNALLKSGGEDGFLLDDMAPPKQWEIAQSLVDAGLVVSKRLYTGTATFTLTDAGRAALKQ